MQHLTVVARLFPAIVNGDKTSTIRWREARIEPGLLTYVCEGKPERTVAVLVARCTDMPLSEAAAFVGKADEWPDAVMLTGMRAHYPTIKMTDSVQVIEHLTPQQTAERG